MFSSKFKQYIYFSQVLAKFVKLVKLVKLVKSQNCDKWVVMINT